MSKKQPKSNSAKAQVSRAPDVSGRPALEAAKDKNAPASIGRSDRRQAFLFGLLAILVLGLAAFFRLYHLGRPSLRADTIVFWNLCRSELGFTDIYRLWMTDLGMKGSGQFPFALAFTKGFLDLFGLPLTQFTSLA